VRALDPATTLDLCDRGMSKSPLERALLVIEAAGADPNGRDEAGSPADWPLGAVNKALLEQRGSIFGGQLELLANCPGCGSICQSEIDCWQLAAVSGASAEERTLKVGRKRVAFRVPTIGDVMTAARSGRPAGEALAQRLIADNSVMLDERLLSALADGVARADPLSSIEIALRCPECGDQWVEPLHVVDVLWTELKARSDRLVMEVARLASAFGWTERDVLSMSGLRRQRYLDLLPS